MPNRIILCATDSGKEPQEIHDLEELFNQVRHGYKRSCYWAVVEPFRFFLDADLYRKNFTYDILDILAEVKPLCEHFLVCQAPTTQGKSYRIFTDRIVDYEEATRIENELKSKFDAIDDVIGKRKKFAYTRSAYSLHGRLRSRMMLPVVEMSRLPRSEMSEFELFCFSCPNFRENQAD